MIDCAAAYCTEGETVGVLRAVSPSGTFLYGVNDAAINYGGSHCWSMGLLSVRA